VRLSYRILLRKEPEGGYTVIVPSLPGCITYGETIEEAIKMAKESIELYIESLREHGEDTNGRRNLGIHIDCRDSCLSFHHYTPS